MAPRSEQLAGGSVGGGRGAASGAGVPGAAASDAATDVAGRRKRARGSHGSSRSHARRCRKRDVGIDDRSAGASRRSARRGSALRAVSSAGPRGSTRSTPASFAAAWACATSWTSRASLFAAGCSGRRPSGPESTTERVAFSRRVSGALTRSSIQPATSSARGPSTTTATTWPLPCARASAVANSMPRAARASVRNREQEPSAPSSRLPSVGTPRRRQIESRFVLPW